MGKGTCITNLSGLLAVALMAAACHDAVTPERTIGAPNFDENHEPPPQQQCGVKITGGGRIDFPPGEPTKNPPASHMFQTFGAHVIQSADCSSIKGSLQWVDHRPDFRVNGRPLNLHSVAITFAERLEDPGCVDGVARWGGRLVVKNTGEEHDFQVFDCDNGEPGARHDGFEIFVPGIGYSVSCPNRRGMSPPLCVLTGGNRQFHKPQA